MSSMTSRVYEIIKQMENSNELKLLTLFHTDYPKNVAFDQFAFNKMFAFMIDDSIRLE